MPLIIHNLRYTIDWLYQLGLCVNVDFKPGAHLVSSNRSCPQSVYVSVAVSVSAPKASSN